MNIFKRLFHRLFHNCGENLEYIEGSRFPETGVTGRGKVWKNYRCSICGKLYTTSRNKLYKISHTYENPIKIICGGSYK